MLAKKFRLTRASDFRTLSGSGRPFFTQFITVKARINKRDHSRIAIVVSTKVSKKAVERNRVKRQLREAVRSVFDQIKTGYDIALYVKKSAIGQPFEQLQKDLETALHKARLLTNK